MSTRACYSFIDADQAVHVYKHHDGYPQGARLHLTKAMQFTWRLPRFEADDIAAAFVVANWCGAGSMGLLPTGPIEDIAPGDLEYRYEISAHDSFTPWVRAFRLEPFGDDHHGELIWQGPLDRMDEWATKYRREQSAAPASLTEAR